MESISKVAFLALLVGGIVQGADEVKLDADGISASMPEGWEKLDRPINYFVQHRFISADKRSTISFGVIRVHGLTLAEFIQLSTDGVKKGLSDTLDKIAIEEGTTRKAILDNVRLRLGEETSKVFKEAVQIDGVELKDVKKTKVGEMPAYLISCVKKDGEKELPIWQCFFEGGSQGDIAAMSFGGDGAEVQVFDKVLGTVKVSDSRVECKEVLGWRFKLPRSTTVLSNDVRGGVKDLKYLYPLYGDAKQVVRVVAVKQPGENLADKFIEGMKVSSEKTLTAPKSSEIKTWKLGGISCANVNIFHDFQSDTGGLVKMATITYAADNGNGDLIVITMHSPAPNAAGVIRVGANLMESLSVKKEEGKEKE